MHFYLCVLKSLSIDAPLKWLNPGNWLMHAPCRCPSMHLHGFSARKGCVILELEAVQFPPLTEEEPSPDDSSDGRSLASGEGDGVEGFDTLLDPASWLDAMHVQGLLGLDQATDTIVSIQVRVRLGLTHRISVLSY